MQAMATGMKTPGRCFHAEARGGQCRPPGLGPVIDGSNWGTVVYCQYFGSDTK
jgi:hypothetical protein